MAVVKAHHYKSRYLSQDATIRNMRYPVELIPDLLSAEMTHKEILKDYPSLENEGILALPCMASKISKTKSCDKIRA